MALVAGVPESVEFHTDVVTIPEAPQPGRQAVLQFSVHDPWKDRPVSGFNLVHEKLFHAFAVSQDLQFFEHGHPSLVIDGVFQYPITFPKPGMYRVLGEFFLRAACLSSQAKRCSSAASLHHPLISIATIPPKPRRTSWGHMLIASSDLIDMMHEHPFLADGGPRVEFEIVFPRPAAYRVWVQFQSDRVVNTVHFDIPVESLR